MVFDLLAYGIHDGNTWPLLSLSHSLTYTHARTQARTHEGHPSKSKQACLIKHCLKTHTGKLLGVLVRGVGSEGKGVTECIGPRCLKGPTGHWEYRDIPFKWWADR